jgi:hypothetical protein
VLVVEVMVMLPPESPRLDPPALGRYVQVSLSAVVELRGGGGCVTGAPEMVPQTARGMGWVVWWSLMSQLFFFFGTH